MAEETALYFETESKIGPILLVATDAGLVRVAYGDDEFAEVITSFRAQLWDGTRTTSAGCVLADTASQLHEYLEGERRDFDIAYVLTVPSEFRTRVLEHLTTISYGDTQTYREVAIACGSESAMRAVGSACATNPLPLVIPCHRVVRSDGSRGFYGGGVEAKDFLLDLELRASA